MRWLGMILFALTAIPVFASEASDTKALDLALKTILRNHLLTAKELECVFLMHDRTEGTVATVDVRENHSKKCGGAPEVSPRRFTIEVDLRTGAALWDNNDDVEMRPVPGRSGSADTWQPLGEGWSRYTNSRFGTVAEVPLLLFKPVDPSPENGDGREFNAVDGARLSVSRSYGLYVVTNSFAAYKVWLVEATKPERATYKAEGKYWLVLSRMNGSTVVYTKAIEGCGAGHEIHIEYSLAKRSFYDPIATRLSRTLSCQKPSLKLGPIEPRGTTVRRRIIMPLAQGLGSLVSEDNGESLAAFSSERFGSKSATILTSRGPSTSATSIPSPRASRRSASYSGPAGTRQAISRRCEAYSPTIWLQLSVAGRMAASSP